MQRALFIAVPACNGDDCSSVPTSSISPHLLANIRQSTSSLPTSPPSRYQYRRSELPPSPHAPSTYHTQSPLLPHNSLLLPSPRATTAPLLPSHPSSHLPLFANNNTRYRASASEPASGITAVSFHHDSLCLASPLICSQDATTTKHPPIRANIHANFLPRRTHRPTLLQRLRRGRRPGIMHLVHAPAAPITSFASLPHCLAMIGRPQRSANPLSKQEGASAALHDRRQRSASM